jgi:peptide/nickel transport system ATP-binding protein
MLWTRTAGTEKGFMMNHLLEVKNLKTYFHMHDHTVRAVDGLDFYLDKKETLGIAGESGCGKSVTSLSIMRLVQEPPGNIVDGEILFEGEDLLKIKENRMREIRGNRISMIFQEPLTSLNPVFTIGYQISEVLRLHRGMKKREALRESIELLKMVGLSSPEERISEYSFQLSGGQRQRAMIAMALACQPDVLIADEPTTALDITIQAQILRLMKKLKESLETSIIFITHDLAVIAHFADRIMIMYAGVLVETAPVRQIFKEPKHPYTQGLLASIPVMGRNKIKPDGSYELLKAIPGNLPEPEQKLPGCRFAPRCGRVSDKCLESEPGLTKLTDNHSVRCVLYEQ